MPPRAIAAGLLSALLLMAMAAPALAQDEQGQASEPITMADVAVASFFRAYDTLPAVMFPDAPAPQSVAEFVLPAREQLWKQATGGLRVPLYLRFVEARCGVDNDAVALVFAELRPPYAVRTYAVAWRGSMPTSPDDEWGGGVGLFAVQDDEAFLHIMGRETTTCP